MIRTTEQMLFSLRGPRIPRIVVYYLMIDFEILEDIPEWDNKAPGITYRIEAHNLQTNERVGGYNIADPAGINDQLFHRLKGAKNAHKAILLLDECQDLFGWSRMGNERGKYQGWTWRDAETGKEGKLTEGVQKRVSELEV